jgi:hypothetical protein
VPIDRKRNREREKGKRGKKKINKKTTKGAPKKM